jgi:hypothetical protein
MFGKRHRKMGSYTAQGRQSTNLFLQSSKLGLPHPLTRKRVCPSPFGSGGRGTCCSMAKEGVGESQLHQFQRGDIHCGTLYMSVYCVILNRERRGFESPKS